MTTLESLMQKGLSRNSANALLETINAGKMSVTDLEERVFETLRAVDDQIQTAVMKEFTKTDLSSLKNKSSFLCGMVKKHKLLSSQREESSPPKRPSTTEDRIKDLLDRTGYPLEIGSGQRRYGGPPPGWEGPPPGQGTEKFCSQVYLGKIPVDMFEDELVPALEKFGMIYELRIMYDSSAGKNKGFAFCLYTTKEAARECANSLNHSEIRAGHRILVSVQRPNQRLFVSGIPRHRSKEDIQEAFRNAIEGVVEVTVQTSTHDRSKNKGYAFIEFDSHLNASQARKKMQTGKVQVFSNMTVDWADPSDDPDDDAMQEVKTLYVKNLAGSVKEDQLRTLFESYGELRDVRRVKDFAFVEYVDRQNSLKAMEEMDGQDLCGYRLEVALAKPVSRQKPKKPFYPKLPHTGASGGGRPHEYYEERAPMRPPAGSPRDPYYPPSRQSWSTSSSSSYGGQDYGYGSSGYASYNDSYYPSQSPAADPYGGGAPRGGSFEYGGQTQSRGYKRPVDEEQATGPMPYKRSSMPSHHKPQTAVYGSSGQPDRYGGNSAPRQSSNYYDDQYGGQGFWQ